MTHINTTLVNFNEADFRAWFEQNAQTSVDYGATLHEALDVMEAQQDNGEDAGYELSGQFTQSGRPAIYYI